MLLVHGFGDDLNPVTRTVRLEVACDRDHDEVVLGIAENAAERFGHADHLVGPALNLNGFADGLDSFEEAASDVAADERHRGVAARLLRGDTVSTVHLYIIDSGYILGR